MSNASKKAIGIEKVSGAKNGNSFISAAQSFYLGGNLQELRPVLESPPKIKLYPLHHIHRLGILTWIDLQYAESLSDAVRGYALTSGEAMDGAMYLFGIDTDLGIECADSVFEVCKSSGNFEFYAGNVLDKLIGAQIVWSNARAFNINIDLGYVEGKIDWLAERMAIEGFNTGNTFRHLTDYAKGYAKVLNQQKCHEALVRAFSMIDNYDDASRFLFDLTQKIVGFASGEKTMDIPGEVPFCSKGVAQRLIKLAEGLVGTRENREDFDSLVAHVGEWPDD